MIGFWDYTVILTFLSLTSTVVGMIAAVQGHFAVAIICLALSGFFDGFDGAVARTKKNRTQQERLYGMQLDSLCDAICFGAFPVLICYEMGLSGTMGILIMVVYSIFAVARLAYFNVLELERWQVDTEKNRAFRGLPVTSISTIFPVVYVLSYWIVGECRPKALGTMLLITGVLFIIDFRVKKLKTWQQWVLIFGIAILLLATIFIYHCT